MRITILAAALAATAFPLAAQDAALLLGVERYEEFRRLSGGDDLRAADDALTDAGYDVEMAIDADGRAMLPQINRFVAGADEAGRLIAALSGRFYTDGARTWLLAADARQPSLFGMGDTAVSIDSLLQVLAQTPGQALLVLGVDSGDDDAIGNLLNAGLGDLEVPQGVSVVIATPNTVDDLLEEATRPGADIAAYVRDNRRMRMIGYQPARLVLQAEDSATPAPAPTPRPTEDPSAAAWAAARRADTADAYRDFLFDYPGSPNAAEARRRLDDIENDPVRLAEIAEDAMNLTRNERRAIQRNLTILEYNTRGVDGIFGPGSRGAIRNWQQRNGFEQTSFLTREQINRIDAQASRRRAEIEAEEARAREEALRLDRAYWDETGARGDEAGYRAYLNRYPEGIFAGEAQAKLDEITGAAREREEEAQRQAQQEQGNAAQEQERRLNVNPVLARLIESRLDQLGFNPGRVDGRFDRDTRGAISRYQSNRGLPATGYLSEPTLARLLADSFGR
ncbi:peptidoglycan-binding domain-containing protein [Yoonia sp. SS1-5]|uniref:Peptidoglycan-binding domain-containing protein n=1 Tax=Yoonia rhodophyticola TaxID=3137370 RepID=A0AAN0MEP1_9RHOB